MNARPSLCSLRPFGQPSYSATWVQSPPGDTLNTRPCGMSVNQRLPAPSKLGPSRKQSEICPALLKSDQGVRTRFLNRSGMRVKTSALSVAGGG